MQTEGLPVDWLERDKHVIEGLDHLGIEVVSANIYGSLLPGITNVTDRARYYSFYPWVLHRYAQRPASKSRRTEWLNWFRRLEFTYAAACAAWEESNDAAEARATAVVGVDGARRLIREVGLRGRVDLRIPADVDAAGKVPQGAYFKNPEGGLGQYYKSPLGVFGLLREDQEHRVPDHQLTTYAGLRVAQAVDAQPAFGHLIEVAGSTNIRVSDLATLGQQINPSVIEPDGEEERLLRALFLGEDEELCRGQEATSRQWRRASLLLALQYVANCGALKHEFPLEFRWACAQLALPDGKPWRLPDDFRLMALAWASYHYNDVMNYALECLFWVALRRVDEGRFTPREVAHHVAALARGPIERAKTGPGMTAVDPRVSDWVAACKRDPRKAVGDPWGLEGTRTWVGSLERAISEEHDAEAAGWALRVLGRVIADHERQAKRRFAAMPAFADMARTYEVHIASLIARTDRRWAEPLLGFVEELVLEWILYRHLRVATRKLAAQGVSTFKFRPETGKLLLVTDKIPKPTFTNPRLKQAHRILVDLHYLAVNDAGVTEIASGGAAAIRTSK